MTLPPSGASEASDTVGVHTRIAGSGWRVPLCNKASNEPFQS
jgi:hypothetical protein